MVSDAAFAWIRRMDRELIVLMVDNGFTWAEIAEQMKMSEDAARAVFDEKQN